MSSASAEPAGPGDRMAGSAAQTTLAGQVIEGVETGCRLLDTGDGEYLLVIPNRLGRSAARVGARLVVRGRVEPGLASHCQQGIPFLVSEILPG